MSSQTPRPETPTASAAPVSVTPRVLREALSADPALETAAHDLARRIVIQQSEVSDNLSMLGFVAARDGTVDPYFRLEAQENQEALARLKAQLAHLLLTLAASLGEPAGRALTEQVTTLLCQETHASATTVEAGTLTELQDIIASQTGLHLTAAQLTALIGRNPDLKRELLLFPGPDTAGRELTTSALSSELVGRDWPTNGEGADMKAFISLLRTEGLRAGYQDLTTYLYE